MKEDKNNSTNACGDIISGILDGVFNKASDANKKLLTNFKSAVSTSAGN